ncbi:MAG: ASKHA domain-containing protein [Gammaproteobacteria bacterium]|nr:ASKHA domain-containing protein [Gammaproteobacteria bacterium]MDH5302616.1 ASKHA domain-containing protein [Gammaproteobacteria bacterium]MDH5322129.1 ASKHA domain-containing protein [Gammaproteobacteria bacterium]
MKQKQAKIVFTPSGKRGEFAYGTTVLDAARSLGVDVDSVCGGRAMCGRCQVVCAEGEFAKHAISSRAEHLSPIGEVETRFAARRRNFKAGRRLSCQARIAGDLVIDVPAESQIHRQLVRKGAEHRDITLDTGVHLYFVEVREADMVEPSGDVQRLLRALDSEWGLRNLKCDWPVLPDLQMALRKGKWQVTVAVYKDEWVIAVWPGFKRDAYGLAIDIGSTTIAANLINLTNGDVIATDGIMNPQIRFGEDLMSRVSYVMMNPAGAAELTSTVRAGINQLIASLAKVAGIDVNEIVDVTIAGNPIMHHLFLGISPVELGTAPFALVTDAALDLRALEVGLDINKGATVYVLPCIAGHVGADAAAMILSEEPHQREEISLIVDVGTNAEIVLGNRDRLLACSSPTGPAFEGAQISCGQRAAPGAIERVRIDPVTLVARFSVIGSELWSDEPGFDEAIQAIGVTGICGSGIIEAVAEMYLRGIISEDGVVDGSLAASSDRLIPNDRTWSYLLYDGAQKIVVTQTDVRQIQLAKAALYAGVKLLLDHAGLETVDRIRLAGAFGSHIDTMYAMVLGLIPDCELDRVESAGNAAGTGARIALLNVGARREIEEVVRKVEKIETAVEPKFQEYFVDAMALPNKTDRFPKLFTVMQRPPPKMSGSDSDRPRRRRQRG